MVRQGLAGGAGPVPVWCGKAWFVAGVSRHVSAGYGEAGVARLGVVRTGRPGRACCGQASQSGLGLVWRGLVLQAWQGAAGYGRYG
jgi:hypothetical protein